MARIITSDIAGFTPYIPPERKAEEDRGAYARKKWSENVHLADQIANSPVAAGLGHLAQEGFKAGKTFIGDKMDEAHAEDLRLAAKGAAAQGAQDALGREELAQGGYTQAVAPSGRGLGEQALQNERNRKELGDLKASGTLSPEMYAAKTKMLDTERARIVADMQRAPGEGPTANYDKLAGTGQYRDMPKVVPASPEWLHDKDTDTLAKLYRAAKATDDQAGMDAVKAEADRRQAISETRGYRGAGGPALAAQVSGALAGADALVHRSFRQAESIPADKLPEAYDRAMQTGNKPLAAAVEARLKQVMLAQGASPDDVAGLRGPGDPTPTSTPGQAQPEAKPAPQTWKEALAHLDDSGLADAEARALKHQDHELADAIVSEHHRRTREGILKTVNAPKTEARPDFLKDTPNQDYNVKTGEYTHRHPDEGPSSDDLRAMARLADTPEKKAEVHRLAAKASLPWTTLADLFTGAHKERFAKALDTEFPKERVAKSAQELLADLQLKDAHKKLYEAQTTDVGNKRAERMSKAEWERQKEANAIRAGKYKHAVTNIVNNMPGLGATTSNEARAENAKGDQLAGNLKGLTDKRDRLSKVIERGDPGDPGAKPDDVFPDAVKAWNKKSDEHKQYMYAEANISKVDEDIKDAKEAMDSHIVELKANAERRQREADERAAKKKPTGGGTKGKTTGGSAAEDTKRKPGESFEDWRKRTGR